jgi:hypothetical protein
MLKTVTVRIQVTQRLIDECTQFACTARTVGSIMGAACLVGAMVALLTSLH